MDPQTEPPDSIGPTHVSQRPSNKANLASMLDVYSTMIDCDDCWLLNPLQAARGCTTRVSGQSRL